jgi:hypothetical protein
MLASMAGEKPRRPQFVGIAQVLRLLTGQRHQPGLGFARDRRLPARTRAIIERSHWAFHHGALNAALDRLMVQPQCPTNRKKTTDLPDRPAIFAPARPGSVAIDLSFAVSSSSSDDSIARRHAAMTSPRSIVGLRGIYRSPKIQMKPFIVTTFMEAAV